MKWNWMRILLLLAVAALLAVIFGFSSQTGPESQDLSMGLVRWVLDLLSLPDTKENLKTANFLLRKAAHFFLYFLLGCCLTGVVGSRESRRNGFLIVVLLGAMFAASDEFHQSFTARTASVADVLLDTCGVAVGGIVFNWLQNRLTKRQG